MKEYQLRIWFVTVTDFSSHYVHSTSNRNATSLAVPTKPEEHETAFPYTWGN